MYGDFERAKNLLNKDKCDSCGIEAFETDIKAFLISYFDFTDCKVVVNKQQQGMSVKIEFLASAYKSYNIYT